MKTQTPFLLAIVLASLASGCQPDRPGDASPANRPAFAPAPPPPTAGDYARAAITNAVSATTQTWAEVKASMQSALADGYDQKEAFVNRTKADLRELDQKISNLTAQAGQAAAADSDSIKAKLRDLRAKRAVLDQKLAAVENASAANWDSAKTNFKSAYDDVKASLQDAWHSLTGS